MPYSSINILFVDLEDSNKLNSDLVSRSVQLEKEIKLNPAAAQLESYVMAKERIRRQGVVIMGKIEHVARQVFGLFKYIDADFKSKKINQEKYIDYLKNYKLIFDGGGDLEYYKTHDAGKVLLEINKYLPE